MEKKSNKYYLRVRTTDPSNYKSVDKKVKEILEEGLVHVVRLPRKIKRFTVQRSHHVHKKSRESLEIRISSRLWVLERVTERQMDNIKNTCATIPGISMDWKLVSSSPRTFLSPFGFSSLFK